MNFNNWFVDWFFMVDYKDIKKVMKYKDMKELESNIKAFSKLDNEYRKVVIVIPYFPDIFGRLHEFISNYHFDILSVRKKNDEKYIRCMGYDEIALYFDAPLRLVSEEEVNEFYNKISSNKELKENYIKAVNDLFYYNNNRVVCKFDNNKKLNKIRRKYEK